MPLVELSSPRMELKKCIPPIPYQIGNGIFFDGVNDYVRVPYNANFDFDIDEAFSICVWLQTGNSLAGTSGSNTITLKYKISPNISGWGLSYLPSGRVEFLLFKAFGATPEQLEYFTTFSALSTNTLYHICATYDNHVFAVYVNGILQSGVLLGSVTQSIKSGSDLDIGGNRYFSRSNNFDTKLFNKALTQSEVTDLYNLIIPFSCLPNLVLDMPFEVLEKPASIVYTPELVIANNGLLVGYPTGAKGIVNLAGANIQLVP